MTDHSDLIERRLVGLISDREIIAGHICIPVDESVSVTNEAAAALREQQAEIERLRKALTALLRRDEIETCQHEETQRGGFIWEMCTSCGAKWADDDGGKPE